MPRPAPRPRPAASLKTVIGAVGAVVAAVALATAGALSYLTTELRRTTEELRAATEAVRLAEEAVVDLLLHARIADPLARREVERDLRERLERAGQLARDGERQAVERATERVEAYLAAPPGPAEDLAALDGAFSALDALVISHVRRSHEADARARRLDRVGDAVGGGTAGLLVVAAAWLVWWLRSRAVEPLLALADAMRRFGAGEGSSRAPERGAAELRDMARRFNEMAAALAALRERQMTLLAGLAHDLRNPLSALKLATSRPPGTGHEGERTLALVRRQVRGLERLVTDVLDAARVEAGHLDVHPEPVDLRPIVEHVVTLFGPTATAHHISAHLPDGAVVAPCDPGRVEQVLGNLVSNAIKYSPGGGEIEVTVDPRPGEVALRVADHGLGIEEGEVEEIFAPFRRGRAVERRIRGVGLGLYVSRRIVEAHGGRIHVTSTPGRGSTFEVVLPR